MIRQQFTTEYGEIAVSFAGRTDDVAGPFEDFYVQLMANNRELRALGYLEQVHGDGVVSFAEATGIRQMGQGDALITQAAGHALVIRTADCIPILFYSLTQPCVAAVHAGWRGLKKSILSRAVERAGRVGELRFVVGPFIGEKSYEVGLDVSGQFAPEHSVSGANGKAMLNLRSALAAEMKSLGIADDQVTWHARDTLTDLAWYSARRGDQRRNFSWISFSAR